jgi:alpha-L-fucosidase
MKELYHLVKTYKPEILWSDGDWEAHSDYWKSKQFLAWLANDSAVKDTAVWNDRWGTDSLCKHGGFLTCTDRYEPDSLLSKKWENAMTNVCSNDTDGVYYYTRSKDTLYAHHTHWPKENESL